MAASFNCPHCEATYPSLPTLYGRTVRCSTCKNPFRLRGDGVVEKVTVAKDKTSTHKRERTEEEKESLTRAFISKSKEIQEQQKPATRRLQRRKKNLQELKSSMSSALSEAANEAIAVERKKEVDKEAPVKRKPRSGAHENAEQVSAVLTGQGTREYRQTKFFIFGCTGFLAICLAALSLFSSDDPCRKALKAFLEPTGLVDHPAKRALAYRQRAWLIGYDQIQQPGIILNLDKADLEEPVEYNITSLATIIEDNIYGMSNFPEWCLWSKGNHKDQIQKIWNKYDKIPPMSRFYTMLKESGIQYFTYEQMIEAMEEKDAEDSVRHVFTLFLAGHTDLNGQNKWMEKMLSGNVPHHCAIARFYGTNGRELRVSANRARYIQLQSYEGLLLKFSGEGWDDSWRLLTAHDVNKKIQNPLQEKVRAFTLNTFSDYDLKQRTNNEPEPEFEDEQRDTIEDQEE